MQRKYLWLLVALTIIFTSCGPGKLFGPTLTPIPISTQTFTPTFTSIPTLTALPTITPAPLFIGSGPINVLAQFGTTQKAIQSAIAVAEEYHRPLYFPAATYTHYGIITMDGIDAYGDGADTILIASDPNLSAIVLKGDGVKLRNMTLESPNASLRQSSPESTGVDIEGATNFVVDHIIIDKMGSVGIFDYGGTHGIISNNQVSNTLADGIHNTNGASDIEIYNNTVTNSGDDMFAVVSYQWDISRCHDISIHDNTGNGEIWGRGATVVGGYNIQIYGNSITHTYGAGIYIASEPAWSTFGVDHVTINSNKIRDPDWGNIHHANILIWGGESDFSVDDVTGSKNDLDPKKTGVIVSGNTAHISVK